MVEQILEYAGIALSAIITIISSAIAWRTKKGTTEKNKKLEKVVELAKIVQKIPDLVIEAENLFPSKNEIKYGNQKMTYVLKEIQLECIQKNVEFDKDAFKYEIEKILETPQKEQNNEKAWNKPKNWRSSIP